MELAIVKGYCGEDECLSRAFRLGLCRTHYGQTRKGKTLKPAVSYPDKWERLQAAVMAYADCPAEDDEEFYRRMKRLRQAAKDWADSLPTSAANDPMPED